jgi:hypothetical protein
MQHWPMLLLILMLFGASGGAKALALPKCSPPAPTDLGMTVESDFGGGGIWAGQTGRLDFVVSHHASSWSGFFLITHQRVPVPSGDAQTFRLHQIPGSCNLNEYHEPGTEDWPEGIYYSFYGPRISPGETVVCSAMIEVLPTATQARVYPFSAFPTFCVVDTNPEDNVVNLAIGGLPPSPVPLAGLGDPRGRIGLLLLALLVAAAAIRKVQAARHRR